MGSKLGSPLFFFTRCWIGRAPYSFPRERLVTYAISDGDVNLQLAHGYVVRVPRAIQPSAADPYGSLPWKQSRKRPDLGTIFVTVNLPPLARELYEKLKASEGYVIIESDTTMYRLSIVDPGRTEYMQRWSRPARSKS